MSFLDFTTKLSKFRNFLNFRQHSPNFGLFRKLTPIRNPTDSGLKRVAKGSIPNRYQTSFFAQLAKPSL